MFEITKAALENLKNYLQQNKIDSPIRIALMQGGCSGATLSLALDTTQETDHSFEQDGLEFLVEKDLLQKCGSLKVDYIDAGYQSGFSITSANPVGEGGGCTPGACGSGSCC